MTGDCERLTRSSSVTVEPSVGSVVRLSNSAKTSGSRSPIAPVAMSVAPGPMPRRRPAMYAVETMASPTNASPPPAIAFLHVKCFRTPVGVSTCNPVVTAAARFRS